VLLRKQKTADGLAFEFHRLSFILFFNAALGTELKCSSADLRALIFQGRDITVLFEEPAEIRNALKA
jgi:hypothetical protein